MTLANLKRQSGGNWTKLDVFMPYTQVHQTPPASCPFRVEDSCAIPINTRVEKFQQMSFVLMILLLTHVIMHVVSSLQVFDN